MYAMSRSSHLPVLLLIVCIVAAFSALVMYRLIAPSDRPLTKDNIPNEKESSPVPTVAFQKTPDGVYIIPTADPTYPLRLGPGTVGGANACERLANLRTCLAQKASPLLSRISSPQASTSANLESVCGKMLNDLAQIRPESVSVGCIF